VADEFYQLKRIVPTIGTAKTKKEKKTKLPKFSKGSWKHAALACLKHAFVGKDTEDFHFVRNENLVVCLDPKKTKVIPFRTRFDFTKLKTLGRNYSKAFVLINAADGTYLRMGVKSYTKLAGIDRIYIKFKLLASYDDDTTLEVYRSEKTITNINELAYYIIHHQHCIDGVYDVQAECYGFADYAFKFKIMVWKSDNTVETYKGDMNDFMEKYGLRMF